MADSEEVLKELDVLAMWKSSHRVNEKARSGDCDREGRTLGFPYSISRRFADNQRRVWKMPSRNWKRSRRSDEAGWNGRLHLDGVGNPYAKWSVDEIVAAWLLVAGDSHDFSRRHGRLAPPEKFRNGFGVMASMLP